MNLLVNFLIERASLYNCQKTVGIYFSTAQRLQAVGVKIDYEKWANTVGTQMGNPADAGVLYEYLSVLLRNLLLLHTGPFDWTVKFYIHIV